MGQITQSYRITVLSLLLGLVLFTGCASSPQQDKKEYTHEEKARLLVGIANGALAENDPTGALQTLLKAEAEDSNLPELYHSRALAYFAKHDLDAAIRSCKKALELNPQYADANTTMGKLLIDKGQLAEAERHLNIAAQNPLFRESYKAWTNLGILKYRQNQISQAEVYLNRAVQEAPDLACIAYYYRGHIRLKESKLAEAVKDYSKATQKRCAQFGDAHLALGMAYQKNHQYGLARKTFLDIEKRYPDTKLAEQALDQLRYLP